MLPETAAASAGVNLASIPREDWTDGTVADVARRLSHLRTVTALIKELESECEDHLIAAMETDVMDVDGVGRVRREETSTSAWADEHAAERMRDDLARAVALSISTDMATGEIDPIRRNIALHTMRAAYEAIPAFSSLKVAGRNRFGLQIGDYRRYGTGYRITLEEVTG